MGETASAQEHSKASESGGCPSVNAGRMGETASAQEHSKASESGGCPSVNAGRMGETASAQEHSKVSESGAAYYQSGKAAARQFSKMSRKERQRLLKNRRETLK
jgi:hypothetical protein